MNIKTKWQSKYEDKGSSPKRLTLREREKMFLNHFCLFLLLMEKIIAHKNSLNWLISEWF